MHCKTMCFNRYRAKAMRCAFALLILVVSVPSTKLVRGSETNRLQKQR